MPVLYGSYSIRPAPLVSISKVFQTTEDGRHLSSTITARLTGTITCEKRNDTYTPVGINSKLSVLLGKQKELRDAFAVNGQMFQIQGFDGSAPSQFPAIVDSLDFTEGIWTDKTDYTISLHGEDYADSVLADDIHCDSLSESWTFEENDIPRTWKASHTVSAKGKLVYDPDGTIHLLPYQLAQAAVSSRVGLGFNAATTFSPLSGADLAGTSVSNPRSTNAWNHTVVESIDETGGSYSVTETWILNENNYVETYSMTVRRVDEPNVTTYASINGVLHGLSTNVGDVETRYANALSQWPTVKSLLVSRCQAQVNTINGGTLVVHPLSLNVDLDRDTGIINYQYEYNDRLLINDTLEVYTVSKTASINDYQATVRVEGTITGQVYLDDAPDLTLRFTRANTQWGIVKSLLFSRAVTESNVTGLQPFPVSAQVTPDHFTGVINYSYEFDNRLYNNVRHEYTVSKKYSLEDGIDIITIDGTITGLRTSPSDPFAVDDPYERYTNAINFYNGISGNLLGLAATYIRINCLNPTPFNTSVSSNPFAGSVAYTAEYTSRMAPLTPGALSEIITITDDDATPVIAVIPVLGRGAGPIIQDINTVTEKRRSISAEIVMTPPKYGCGGYPARPTFDSSPYAPSGSIVRLTQDQTSWLPYTGRLSRNVAWIYQ